MLALPLTPSLTHSGKNPPHNLPSQTGPDLPPNVSYQCHLPLPVLAPSQAQAAPPLLGLSFEVGRTSALLTHMQSCVSSERLIRTSLVRPGFLVKDPAPQEKRLLALRLKAEGRGSVSPLRQGLLGAGAVSHPKRMILKVGPNLLFLDLEQMPRTRNSTTSQNVYKVALFSSFTAVLTTDTHGRAVPSAARSQVAPAPQLAPVGRLPLLPLIESVLGAVPGAQLLVLLRMVVLRQLAQAVEEPLKADLVVLVLVCHPEQFRDGVRLLPALRGGQRVNHAPRHRPASMARPSAACRWEDRVGDCGLALPGGGLQDIAPHSNSQWPGQPMRQNPAKEAAAWWAPQLTGPGAAWETEGAGRAPFAG